MRLKHGVLQNGWLPFGFALKTQQQGAPAKIKHPRVANAVSQNDRTFIRDRY